MHIAGLQKLTLLDFPGRLACTVFLPGCNLRCPFCHNASLVLPREDTPPPMTVDELLDFLRKRKGRLQGVCITGGEPMDFTYGDCKKEMDIVNRAFIEVMIEGDANGRGFQYPIPSYHSVPEIKKYIASL